jgi:hypothetical protein
MVERIKVVDINSIPPGYLVVWFVFFPTLLDRVMGKVSPRESVGRNEI